MTHQPSLRAQLVTRRTYNRPKSEDESSHESWEETVNRVIDHQRWLWQREGTVDELELEELRALMLERKMSVSGRTLSVRLFRYHTTTLWSFGKVMRSHESEANKNLF